MVTAIGKGAATSSIGLHGKDMVKSGAGPQTIARAVGRHRWRDLRSRELRIVEQGKIAFLYNTYNIMDVHINLCNVCFRIWYV